MRELQPIIQTAIIVFCVSDEAMLIIWQKQEYIIELNFADLVLSVRTYPARMSLAAVRNVNRLVRPGLVWSSSSR